MNKNYIQKLLNYLILSLTLITSVYSQDAGNSGLSFLKLGASAKSISAADIGLLNSDPASVFYNPAAVNLQNSASLMFTHQIWIQDLTSEILGANFSLFGLPFAIGVNTTKIKGFEIRTKPSAEPDGLFNANYFYGSISSGFTIIENLEFGVTIKYLYESLLSDDASGTGYDFGLIYSDLIQNLNVGFSMRNLGSMDALKTEKTKLPSDFIVNSTYKYDIDNSSFSFLPIFGIQKYLETENLHLHLGTDILYSKQFAVRLGYITGYESKGLTAGAGFYWNGFNVDYAFTPFKYGLGNANTITLTYSFK